MKHTECTHARAVLMQYYMIRRSTVWKAQYHFAACMVHSTACMPAAAVPVRCTDCMPAAAVPVRCTDCMPAAAVPVRRY